MKGSCVVSEILTQIFDQNFDVFSKFKKKSVKNEKNCRL